jgi:UPF0716 family protein affecting phage T7 exclusion
LASPILAVLIGIADPILLYFIWSWWGGWVLAGVLFGPWLVGGVLVAVNQRLQMRMGENAFPGMIVDAFLIPAARMMILYPGPITSLLGILLLIPAVRRILSGMVLRRVMKGAMGGGGMSMMSNMGGFSMFGGGMGPAAPGQGGLKRAEGEVIDDRRRLDEPDDEFDAPPKKR